MYEDNLPWVAGVKVEKKKSKKGMKMKWVAGVKVEVRKNIEISFRRKRKRYEDQLGSKLEQQLFPGNSARKLVGYFNDAK